MLDGQFDNFVPADLDDKILGQLIHCRCDPSCRGSTGPVWNCPSWRSKLIVLLTCESITKPWSRLENQGDKRFCQDEQSMRHTEIYK